MVQDTGSRVLVLAPTSKDAEVTRALLERAGLKCVACRNTQELVKEAAAGVGAILTTDDVLEEGAADHLSYLLKCQPVWSEPPVVVLASDRQSEVQLGHLLEAIPHATILDRPAPMRTVVSAVHTAVRARLRQYQIRDQIDQLAQATDALSQLLESEQSAREAAERAGRTKDEFLATLSHELRTPLNAIVGWSQMLRRPARTDEDLAQGLETIERNARLQAQLIDDLLDMSRIISGKLRLEMHPIDPVVFIEAAVQTVRTAADAKGIVLDKTLDPRAGPVSGDSNRLQQVVWNLLSNAIKFTPQGGRVSIVLERTGSQVRLCVSDTGVGIPADFLPHVFERFRQADASTTRRHGGLGLGLAIVKQLVELHGGQVKVDSRGLGQGSSFTVTLPLDMGSVNYTQRNHDDPSAGTTGQLDVSLAGLKVLAVDDEPDALNLVRRILQDCDAVVRTCSSAEEAMSAVVDFEPDILVSDIGMPDVDGYEFLRRLSRSLPRKLPAIALTAFARPEDGTRALLAGYQAHLVKPVQPRELVAMVSNISRQSNRSTA